jgi:hypothetical protein
MPAYGPPPGYPPPHPTGMAPPPPKSGASVVLIILGVVVVVLLLGGAAVWFMLRRAVLKASANLTPGALQPAPAPASDDARLERCRAILRGLDAGQLSRADEVWLGDKGARARRIANRALNGADLKVARSALPCGDESLDLLAKAATKSTAAWDNVVSVNDVSPHLVAELSAKPKPALAPEAAAVLEQAAEDKAKGVLRGGARTLDDFGPAKGLCELATTLLGKTSPSCETVAKRTEALLAKDAAAKNKR